MDSKELLKELLYKWVEKIVEDLEKLTTEKQKEETKQTKDAMLIGMAMNDELPPVAIEQIHTMSPVKEEIKITSGEVWYKVKKMVEISNDEMEKMKTKLWRNDNKEKVSKYNKTYYEKNKEKIKEQQREYWRRKQEKKKQEQKELELKFNKAWEFSNNYSLLP